MEKIGVTILDVTGSKTNQATWSVTTSVETLVKKLIEVSELPVQDPVGRPIRYELYHLRERRGLNGDETPATADIRDGDTLYLHLDITVRRDGGGREIR